MEGTDPGGDLFFVQGDFFGQAEAGEIGLEVGFLGFKLFDAGADPLVGRFGEGEEIVHQGVEIGVELADPALQVRRSAFAKFLFIFGGDGPGDSLRPGRIQDVADRLIDDVALQEVLFLVFLFTGVALLPIRAGIILIDAVQVTVAGFADHGRPAMAAERLPLEEIPGADRFGRGGSAFVHLPAGDGAGVGLFVDQGVGTARDLLAVVEEAAGVGGIFHHAVEAGGAEDGAGAGPVAAAV